MAASRFAKEMNNRRSTTMTFVIGATGCGKTAVAVALARAQRRQDDDGAVAGGDEKEHRRFICVINCDVLQFYQGLPIATNKASLEELTFEDGSPIPHYFMSFLSPDGSRKSGVTSTSTYHSIVASAEVMPAAKDEEESECDATTAPPMYHIHDYVKEVESFLYDVVFPQCAADITTTGGDDDGLAFQQRVGCSVIVCGGSHYYAQSLLFEGGLVANTGDSDAGATVTSKRDDVEVATPSGSRLWDVLNSLDPKAASQVHPQNTRRIERMIELARQGRKPSDVYSAQHGGGDEVTAPSEKKLLKLFTPRLLASTTPHNPTQQSRIHPLLSVVWVDGSREWLQSRLDARVDDMMARGMVREVQELGEWVSQYHRKSAARTKRPRDCDDALTTDGSSSGGDGLVTSTLLSAIGFKEWAPLFDASGIGAAAAAESTKLDTCVASVKQATRRYARQQVQWVKNRFLGVYRNHWEQQVCDVSHDAHRPECSSASTTTLRKVPFFRLVMDACLAMKTAGAATTTTQQYLDQCVSAEILPRIASQDGIDVNMALPSYLENPLRCGGGACDAAGDKSAAAAATAVDRKTLHTCSLCELVVSGEDQWAAHMESKRHKGALRHQALVEQQRALGREIPARGSKKQHAPQ